MTDVEVIECSCSSVKRACETGAERPWETVVTVVLRSSDVPYGFEHEYSRRIGHEAAVQFAIECDRGYAR